jgi:hypothetical protein
MKEEGTVPEHHPFFFKQNNGKISGLVCYNHAAGHALAI